MNKVQAVATGTAVVAVLAFQQLEIAAIYGEMTEIKQFLIHSDERIKYTKADEECLAKNVFYEAGVEPIEGKFAVAQVTINRLKKGTWGNSICRVVHAPKQFSWTLRKHHEKPRGISWDQSRAVASAVLNGVRVDPLRTATHYHADYVQPRWAKAVAKIQQVGRHIFYA